jgi:hypothetical protein
LEDLPGIGLGLELLDNVFLGVPGGVCGGVAPLPFARLSPETSKAMAMYSQKY